MIPQQVLTELETLKQAGAYKDALSIANQYLAKDLQNKEALYQIADIEYRMGKLERSEKPIDFLIASDKKDDMAWYLKGVIAMEKTHWDDAKKYLKKALKLVKEENPEILRCYGLSQYRSGEKESGLANILKARSENKYDAEILLNLTEIYIMEGQYGNAQAYIDFYFAQEKNMMFFDRTATYYAIKLALFQEFIDKEQNAVKKSKKPLTSKKTN